MARTKTRTSWRPGQSGNPRGRPPRGTAIADLLREALDRKLPNGKIARVVLAEQLVKLALTGRQWTAARRWAVETLLLRTEGRPAFAIDIQPDRGAERAERQAQMDRLFLGRPKLFEQAMRLSEKLVELDTETPTRPKPRNNGQPRGNG
ncbi:MAG: DUF5681 domain-containing protein [Planctomycetota bacterium]